MSTHYDAAAASSGPVPAPAAAAVQSDFHHLPDIYQPKRRFLPPAFVTGMMFLAVAGAFYGAEALLPPEYKPSFFIGGYQRAIAEAQAEGQLKARIVYDARLKLIETDAIRWQENCRAGLQNINNLYQAAYARANMYAQSTADIQKHYASARYATTQQTLGGEIAVANLGTIIGFGIGLFDPETGQRSMALAEQARQQALQKLDDAARSGITVSVEGWNTGLPDPVMLPASSTCDMPASLVSPQPSLED